jgi:hypothetical protein
MPITYRIDTKQGLVLTAATGVLTDDELLEHKRALAADPTFSPGMRQLSDVRGVERLAVTLSRTSSVTTSLPLSPVPISCSARRACTRT